MTPIKLPESALTLPERVEISDVLVAMLPVAVARLAFVVAIDPVAFAMLVLMVASEPVIDASDPESAV